MNELENRDLARAEAFGRIAARARLGVRACPYEADGPPAERVLAARFVTAYLRAGGVVPIGGPAEDSEEGWRPARLRNGRRVSVRVQRRSDSVATQGDE